MTSSVLPPLSSNVTVVTGPPSPPSSLVHTRRRAGVTPRTGPKNAIASGSNSRRYLPPTRTSISQESRDIPIDFGIHHRLNSSGLVHASNTMRAGPLKVRVTTSSRLDFRSTVVRFFMGVGSLFLPASIDLLLPFQLLDNLVQLVEAGGPELAVPLDPCRLFLQSAQAELAGPHAPDLLRGDEPRLLQDADMLLHAREGHVELLGKVRDRRVCTSELLQNAASGDVRERGERGIEAGPGILNHVVQYIAHGLEACKGRLSAPALPAAFTPQSTLFRCRFDRPGDPQTPKKVNTHSMRPGKPRSISLSRSEAPRRDASARRARLGEHRPTGPPTRECTWLQPRSGERFGA